MTMKKGNQPQLPEQDDSVVVGPNPDLLVQNPGNLQQNQQRTTLLEGRTKLVVHVEGQSAFHQNGTLLSFVYICTEQK